MSNTKEAKEKQRVIVETKGITMIALIVSVTVLLVIAGVTVYEIYGKDKLLSEARDKSERTEQSIELPKEELNNIAEKTGEYLTDPDGTPYVAKIQDKLYTKLQTAIDEVKDNGKQVQIFLLKDIEENIVIIENQNIKLDLMKNTIKNADATKPTIDIRGKLDIREGSVTGEFNTQTPTILLKKVGTLSMFYTNVTRGTKNKYETIEANGNLTIESGNVTSENDTAIRIRGEVENPNITIGGTAKISNKEGSNYAIINSQLGVINIVGGEISSEQSGCIENNGVVNISENAKITGSNYQTYEGETYPAIVNQKNSRMEIKGGEIIGQKGYALSNGRNASMIITQGTITGNDGSAIYNGGKMQISEKATIEGKSNYPSIQNDAGADLNISGGTIKSQSSNCIENYGEIELKGTAEVSGSDYINSSGNSFPAIINQSNGHINIVGGKITGEKGNAIWNKENAQSTLVGGTIIGKNGNTILNDGILIISGTIQIEGWSKDPTIYNNSTGTLTISGETGKVRIINTGGGDAAYNNGGKATCQESVSETVVPRNF